MSIKILMFGWEFPPHHSGGLGVACKGIVEGLLGQNLIVNFVLPLKTDLSGSHNFKIHFPKKDLQFTARVINSGITPYISSSFININGEVEKSSEYNSDIIAKVLAYEEEAEKIADKVDHQVIHSHDWLSFGAGVRSKKRSGKPMVAHIHATEFDRSGSDNVNEFVFRKEKQGFEESDKIVAVSNYTKSVVVNKYGIDESKIEVVHNGIDQSEYNLPENKRKIFKFLHDLKEDDKKIVLFLGRITIQKNPDGLLKVAERIISMDDDVYFVFAGNGDMMDYLVHETARLRLTEKIIFPGFLNTEQKKELYSLADLFVMPSLSEPFGIVPLESIINGTPVLISKQSGVSEVLNHSLKCDFWDEDEMINMILSSLAHETLRNTMIDHSRIEVENLTWGRAAEKLKFIYENLMI